ncbi:histidine triad nucleotide-binding protein [Patescibacteria group bacterium]|nr:histidine triad nucleotide-binding protein [Patescibacteria group bacterium]MBU0777163.1 histidine triad nucleotide-binding protein [Patescibacteria group bacterium]MBU0845857.1 histidine triad nucleotide-binding protein [Patescibacteria group bacterium]MBU0922884.1 histidine triad nucleotide-binding protein [Patescibacteria group bacterium]MBU1066383.1 histidine triad nucleotide-binding protein [Patescibacteria group bacterium]
MDDCIFCKIVNEEIPTKFEWNDNEVVAFDDINPIAPVHIVIIPKRHIESLKEVKKEDVELLGKIQKIASELAGKKGIKDAFRVLTASGKGAGQTVFHLHYHLIGGWKDKAPEMEAGKDEQESE